MDEGKDHHWEKRKETDEQNRRRSAGSMSCAFWIRYSIRSAFRFMSMSCHVNCGLALGFNWRCPRFE